MKKIALVRGKFLNRYEMQMYEPLVARYDITAFASLKPIHDQFRFPVVKLASPMDLPQLPYKMPVLNRLFTDAHYLLGLEHKLKGFDLVHTAETYYHYTQQCLNAKRRGYVKKVIATVLENIPFNNEGIWGRNAFKRRARLELDHIIALSQKAKESLVVEGANPEKISVLGFFIDTKRFRPPEQLQRGHIGQRGRSVRILFVGRLEVYKGVFDILDAVVVLSQDPDMKAIDITVDFVGTGSQIDRMREKERQISKFWHFRHESATYDQMPEIYRNADIFIAPSKPISTWEEQYGMALLEAQASGLPIITTRSGSIPENVGDAAILVQPGDVTALAAHLKTLILSPQKRLFYGNRAQKRAGTVHDIRLGVRQLTKIYEHVLNS